MNGVNCDLKHRTVPLIWEGAVLLNNELALRRAFGHPSLGRTRTAPLGCSAIHRNVDLALCFIVILHFSPSCDFSRRVRVGINS